jgi:hypothetical protein
MNLKTNTAAPITDGRLDVDLRSANQQGEGPALSSTLHLERPQQSAVRHSLIYKERATKSHHHDTLPSPMGGSTLICVQQINKGRARRCATHRSRHVHKHRPADTARPAKLFRYTTARSFSDAQPPSPRCARPSRGTFRCRVSRQAQSDLRRGRSYR